MSMSKYRVGQEVVASMFGKSHVTKITACTQPGDNPAWSYQVKNGQWYPETCVKPLEAKFKVGDRVDVFIPDWGLGTVEVNLKNVKVLQRHIKYNGDPTYLVEGEKEYVSEHWVSAAKRANKFKVGDKVNPNWNVKSVSTVTDVAFVDGLDCIKLEDRYDFGAGGWLRADSYKKYVKPEEYKFKLDDRVMYIGQDRGVRKDIPAFVRGRATMTSGARYYTIQMGTEQWNVTERELTLSEGDNAAGIKGLASRVKKLEDTVYREVVPGDFKVGDKVKVDDYSSTYVVSEVLASGRLNLKMSLESEYNALLGINPKYVTKAVVVPKHGFRVGDMVEGMATGSLYTVVAVSPTSVKLKSVGGGLLSPVWCSASYYKAVWHEKEAYDINLGDQVMLMDTEEVITVTGVNQGGSFNSYVTIVGMNEKDVKMSKMFQIDGGLKVKKRG